MKITKINLERESKLQAIINKAILDHLVINKIQMTGAQIMGCLVFVMKGYEEKK